MEMQPLPKGAAGMSRRRIINNFLSFSSGQIIAQGIVFLTLIYIARVIGPEGLGRIGFAQVFASYFVLLTDMGLNLLGAREVASDRRRSSAYLNTILSLKLALSLLLFLALVVMTGLIDRTADVRFLIIIYGLVIFPAAATLDWFFVGIEKMRIISLVSLARSLVFLGLCLAFVRGADDIVRVALAFLASYVVSAVLYFISVERLAGYRARLDLSFGAWRKMALMALPIGALTIMGIMIEQQSVLVLGLFGSPESVGLFYGVYKLIFIGTFIIGLYGTSIFPALTKTAGSAIMVTSVKAIAVVGLPVVTLLSIFDGEVITLLLGEQYAAASGVFRIMLWALPLVALTNVFSRDLVSKRRDRSCLAAMAAGFLTALVLSLTLIPAYGLTGAAWCYFAGFAVTAVATGGLIIRTYRVRRWQPAVDVRPAAGPEPYADAGLKARLSGRGQG